MEIKERFKKTEAGLIPQDWLIRSFSSVAKVASGQVDPKKEPYASMTLVAPDHIESSTGRLLKEETAKEQQAISGKYIFSKGDVVYSKIRPYLKKVILAEFDGLCSADMYPLKPLEDVNPVFLKASLLGYRFSKYAESVSVRSGMPKINRIELAEFSFVFPPTLKEQEAIANALSSADAYIESLEKLIAKKRLIKKGVMQELLTGKKRLPHFTNEWRQLKIGDLGIFLKGRGIKKDQASSGPIPCVRYGEIYTDHNDIIRRFRSYISTEVSLQATKLRTGDVLFAGSGETKEEIGKCVAYTLNEEAFAGGDIVILRPSQGNSIFLGYYLNSSQIVQQKASRGQGDAVVHISSSSLGSIKITIPEDDEQAAIAQVISDIDLNIIQTEDKLQKAHLIKQGMMQELLTGRIRLI